MARPLKYKTASEMQHKIDLYFLSCKAHQLDNKELLSDLNDEEMAIINSNEDTYPTVTGLAYMLEITRKSLIRYEERKGFVYTVARAKLRILASYEQRLFTARNVAGVIFSLKNNYGWVDKQEITGEVAHTFVVSTEPLSQVEWENQYVIEREKENTEWLNQQGEGNKQLITINQQTEQD